jgi:hypothetical protein
MWCGLVEFLISHLLGRWGSGSTAASWALAHHLLLMGCGVYTGWWGGWGVLRQPQAAPLLHRPAGQSSLSLPRQRKLQVNRRVESWEKQGSYLCMICVAEV